jgi:hypothetical protein
MCLIVVPLLVNANPLPAEGGRDEVAGGCQNKQFRSLPRAGYFCFGKSSQNHCTQYGGFDNIVLSKLPLVLADRAPARTRTSLCSNIRAFPARPAAHRGAVQGRVKSSASTSAIHGLLHRLIARLHVMNAVITKSTARITIEENTTVRVVEYATPSLVGGAV